MAHHLVVIGKILSKGINFFVEVTRLIVLLKQIITDYTPGFPISDKGCILCKKPFLVHCGETRTAGARMSLEVAVQVEESMLSLLCWLS